MSNTTQGRIARALAQHLTEDTDHLGDLAITSATARDDAVLLEIDGARYTLPIIPQ